MAQDFQYVNYTGSILVSPYKDRAFDINLLFVRILCIKRDD